MSQAKPSSRQRVYLSPPHVGEEERRLLLEAFDSNWIAPLGPHVDAFEQEFAARVGVEHAVAMSSGTATLHLALIVSGVRPGDRVITSGLTFVATANAIRHAGATPVFVDSTPESWNLDPELVEATASRLASQGTPATAVMPVDLIGQCADYDALRATCDRHGLRLIADAAEALGASYRGRPAGSLADVSCFSFNGNKIITTSSGGMLVTDNAAWANRARHLASQARRPGDDYLHDEVGFNYRMSNLLAAVGRGQLAKLDDRVRRRREIFATYRAALGDLPGVHFMPEAAYGVATRWLTCLLIDPSKAACDSNRIRERLRDENIECRPVWKPMHLQPAHRGPIATRVAGLCVAESLWRSGLCLPSGSSLTESDQQRVIDVCRDCLTSADGKAAA